MSTAVPVPLTEFKAGIDRRLNQRGRPDRLYSLVNGWIDGRGVVRSRPGSVVAHRWVMPTKGLAVQDGKLCVFSHCPANADDVPYYGRLYVLSHPTAPRRRLKRIHFAEPVLGALYVAAEFTDGACFHYWLQPADAWEAETPYADGDLVEPTDPNGYVYRAHRIGDPAPVWQAGVARAVADVIEPTVPNGYRYECTDTLGANPRSGTTEPTWPTETGEVVYEDTDLSTATPPAPGAGDDGTGLPDDIDDRYDNPGGGGGNLGDFLGRIDQA